MTRPWRRITLHLSQIGLTLGFTFTVQPFLVRLGLLVPVDDPTPGEVVRRELHHHAVLREDPDVVLAHLAADVGENLVSVGQFDPEHGIRKGLHDGALHLDHAFFLRHVLHNLLDVGVSLSTVSPGTAGAPPSGGAPWTSSSASESLIPAHARALGASDETGSREAPRNATHVGPTHECSQPRLAIPNRARPAQ